MTNVTPLRATYRLQFHRDFTFADARALVPYLARLGISHLYASPITSAVPGSTHGYDVTDPTRINPELGGEAEFERLAEVLADHGMGMLLDIVPNHMASSSHNPFWSAMLEGGPDSEAARVFDVAWERGQLVLPLLGQPLQASLEAGELALRLNGTGRIVVAYADHAFPLRAETVAELRGGEDSSSRELEARLARADLKAVLDAQHWRLSWWRSGAHNLNYRRFFNITDLAGVRIEDEAVFELVHRLPLDLLRRGLIHGLRIDHIDGLVDPAAYCARLREAVGEGVPIFIEKILEPGEKLRPWPIDGTTGYERLNDINGLFVDPAGYAGLEQALRQSHILTGTLPARLAAAKRQVLEASFRPEVDTLAALARDGLDEAMAAVDLTDTAIRDGVLAMLVHCPVYRSYATSEGHDEEDRAIWATIRAAIEAHENPLVLTAAGLLLDRLEAPERPSDREFLSRFQQLSGPAMAKGFEDTELYRVPVLLSVNEVGGSLEHPARSHDELHALNEQRARAKARDLTPLATHDTKRGPGARARLTAISFMPERWLEFTRDMAVLWPPAVGESAAPDALDRQLILQTLVAAWPISSERMNLCLTKALREAKRHTGWETPNETYEQAALAFATELIETPQARAPRTRLEALVEALAPATRMVLLAQLVLQHTLQGVPDIYQGTEFPDFSLVDPDNRRPVDFSARRAALDGEPTVPAADRDYFDALRALLALRRDSSLLIEGDHRRLRFDPSPWQWFGFERRSGDQVLRVIVPTRWPDDGIPPVVEGIDLSTNGGTALIGKIERCDNGRLDLSAGLPLLVARL